MTLNEAQRRIVARMSHAERAEFEQGCQIVDFYMGIVTNPAMPAATKMDARLKLRACAHRQPGQTVMSVVGKAHN